MSNTVIGCSLRRKSFETNIKGKSIILVTLNDSSSMNDEVVRVGFLTEEGDNAFLKMYDIENLFELINEGEL